MIVPDTSVLVAGFVPDHRFHGCLIAHTTAETYAVLSAPSGVYRIEPATVVAYLDQLLEGPEPVQPRPDTYREALGLLSSGDRGGGSIYDALIALAARDAGATLVSLDRRAQPTYELCGVETRFLDEADAEDLALA